MGYLRRAADPAAGSTSYDFVVDPSKFDFYVMDCYRVLREDKLAETYAHQVINAGTGYNGNDRPCEMLRPASLSA